MKVLVENTAASDAFSTEHGLSLHIETGGTNLLFDMGASDLFLENARKLGVDLSAVDLAVVSHGHSDHGGGLALFLRENQKAKVYLHAQAFEKHTVRRPDGSLSDAGLDPALLRQTDRLVLARGRTVLGEGMELFSGVSGRELFPTLNRTLMMEQNGEAVPDDFAHEHNLVLRDDGRLVLFAGCAHNGIVNIVRQFSALYGRFPDVVVGGFHLFGASAGQSEPADRVAQIGAFLKGTPARYYTGHCTGDEAYAVLKDVMGEQLGRLATGATIEV